MNAFLTSDVTGQRVNFCFCALWHWKSRLCFRVEWKIDDRLESNSFNNFLSLLHLTFQSLCDLINSLFPKSNSFSFTFSQTSHLETPSTSRSFHLSSSSAVSNCCSILTHTHSDTDLLCDIRSALDGYWRLFTTHCFDLMRWHRDTSQPSSVSQSFQLRGGKSSSGVNGYDTSELKQPVHGEEVQRSRNNS